MIISDLDHSFEAQIFVRIDYRMPVHAIDDESVKARGYLQALGEQLAAAARQVDDLSRTEDEAKTQTP